MIEVILAALATYGIATLVSEYDGPFNVFTELRTWLPALRCVPCGSVWIAAPIALLSGVGFIGYLAALGIVMVMERSL